MTKQEFISLANAAAQASSAQSGFPAGVTVAQAALESAWGASLLAAKANNYFGIKAAPGKPCISLATTECVAGSTSVPSTGAPPVVGSEAKKVIARFARYPSIAACFAARDRIILTAPCYAEARQHAREPIAFIHSLAKFWATDPAYAEKLEALYLQNHFADLNSEPSPAQPAASTAAE